MHILQVMKWLKGMGLVGTMVILILALPVVRAWGYASTCRSSLENCMAAAPKILNDLKIVRKVVRLSAVDDLVTVLEKAEPFLNHREYLLGEAEPVSYTVLLLNDQELRTNGGFMGSYAVVDVNKGEYQVRFQDIYVPDGQVEGYIAPPEPLQRAFKTGSHRLPNADWSPDFTKSAAAIRWFFDKGGEIEPDVLVTLNLSTVEEIMKVIGPVKVSEYGEEIGPDNFYKWLQDNTEVDFFPGSTQKRDVITATGKAVMQKIESLGLVEKVKIAKLVLNDLENKNILVNSLNESVQDLLVKNSWAGDYFPIPCSGEDCQAITVGVVEMNLGSNKANCCVERITKHKITSVNGRLVHLIELELTNTSMYEEAMKPVFYGGNYLSYLRFYLPEEAENIQVSALPTITGDIGIWPKPYQGDNAELDIEQVYGFTEVGLFNTTRAGTTSWVKLIYEVEDKDKNLQLSILKQRGLRHSPTEVEILGEEKKTGLGNDYLVLVGR